MKESVQEEYDEYCEHCGYVRGKDESLPEEGAPISGMYYICPKCGKDWMHKRKNIVRTDMVHMTKEEYESIINK